MHYIYWALLGMAGYSAVTLLVKLATRNGEFSSFLVLAIACIIVGVVAISIAAYRGDFQVLANKGLLSTSALWSYATGVALAIAVCSLFRALSLGPVSTVVPIYGMFVVGGSILGMFFLNEPVSLTKVLGIAAAALSIFLITR